MQAVVLRRQPIAFSHVMLDPAAVTVAPSRSGALLNARQQHAGSCNAQAADRIITRHTWPCRCDCRSVSLWRSAHGSSVACRQQIARARVMPRFAAVASLAGALVSCSTRHACSAACRLQIASTCVTLHVALWLTRWCLHLVHAASQLHAGGRSVHASARSCLRDAALRRCGFALWWFRLM